MYNKLSIQFLNGFFDRMSDVVRYSWTKVLKKENLAEHSYYVSIISDCIVEDIEKNFEIKIDKYKVLKYALYHDIEEIFTWDIVSPVKYKSEKLRQELEKVGYLILEEEIQKSFPKHIANMIINTHKDYEEHKQENLENMIVKFADIIQAISYTISEQKLWNTYLQHVTQNLINILKNKYWNTEYFSAYVEEILEFLYSNNYL